MPRPRLNSQDRVKLREQLNIGDRVEIIYGSYVDKLGKVISVSELKNNKYYNGKCKHSYDNYFTVRVMLKYSKKIVDVSCNYVRIR